MFKKYFLFALIFFGINVSANAQQTARQFVLDNTEIVPIKSAVGRDYELVVILPASFKSNPNKKYPVLYFADAYWDTPLLAATYGNLIFDNLTPEFIMVGLSYPKGANYDKERRLDLTFTQLPGEKETTGGARAFLNFIKQQVAPLIESQYRGSPSDRILSGNSLGGLFALTAAYQSDNFFTGYVAISPAAQWDNQALATLDKTYAQTHKALDARIFISYGTIEYAPFRDPIIQFQQQLAARKYKGLALQNYSMQGLDHTTVKGDGYVRGLMWVFQPKKPAGPSGLERAFTGAK